MATVARSKLLTAEEFMAAEVGEGSFELVRGEIFEVPLAMPEHGVVCANVAATLWNLWVVYPASRSVVIHRLDDEPPLVLREDAVIENLPELPGFRCPVADFFV